MDKKLIILVLFLSFPSSLFAEKIVFNSGRIVEGKVIQKTDKEIKIEASGMFMVYPLREIETIDGQKVWAYTAPAVIPEGKSKLTLAEGKLALNKGIIFLDQQMYDQAILEFSKAIEVNPEFIAYYNRGIANAKKENLDQAISDYTKAIEINPNDPDAYYNRGLTYQKKNNFNQAVVDYTKSIELAPNGADVYYNRSLAYYKEEKYDLAWQDAQKAQDLGYKVDPKFLQELKKPPLGLH